MTAVPESQTDLRITREAWLEKAIEIFRPRFAELEYPLPARHHVSVGFGHGAKRENDQILGQCWARIASADEINHIFISPVAGDTAEVLRILLHELIHSALDNGEGIQDGHRGAFADLAEALGFTAPMTTTPAGMTLACEFVTIAESLGEYPHGALDVRTAVKVTVGPNGTPVPRGGGRVSTGPKEQRNRHRKLQCTGRGCACGGYTVRTTTRWIEVGSPSCPAGTVMTIMD